MKDITKKILAHPLFAGLSKVEAEDLALRCKVMRLNPDQRIFSQGEVAGEMFVLFHGTLNIRVRDIMGEEKEVGQIKTGEFFGEMGVLEKKSRSASVFAATDAVILVIPGEEFYEMISQGHSAIRFLLKAAIDNACSRLRQLDTRLDQVFSPEEA